MHYIKLKGQEKILIKNPNLIAQPDMYTNFEQNVLVDFFSFKTTELSFENVKSLFIHDNITSFELFEDNQLLKTFDDFTSIVRISECYDVVNNNNGVEIVLKKPNV